MLKVRILTAVVLGLALLVTLFLLPAPWTVVVFAAVFTLAAWEWSGFGALHSPAARAAYTLAIAALLAICWRWSDGLAHLVLLLELACLWWAAALAWLGAAAVGRSGGSATARIAPSLCARAAAALRCSQQGRHGRCRSDAPEREA